MFSLIIIPIIAALIVQAIKLATDHKPHNLNFKHIISDYGGMPSSHAAYVASLATIIGLSEGFDSAAFAIAFVIFVIVIRDAVGFRREIGKDAVLTNRLAKKTLKDTKFEYLTEQIGHTPLQVIIGTICGVVLAIGLAYLIGL